MGESFSTWDVCPFGRQYGAVGAHIQKEGIRGIQAEALDERQESGTHLVRTHLRQVGDEHVAIEGVEVEHVPGVHPPEQLVCGFGVRV